MKFLSVSNKLKLYGLAVANLSYLAGKKNLSPPIIAWLLTKRCNLTCVHCNSYLDKKRIDAEGLMRIAHKIANSDTLVVILSGGEPLMVPNIREIITLLKSKGKIVKLNTNGLNLEKFNDFLIETGVDAVTVSIDDLEAEGHDAIRGKQGSYAKAIQNLEYLKKHRKKQTPYTEVRGVLMLENYSMMPQYIRKFKQLVDHVEFQPIHNNSAHHEVVENGVLFQDSDNSVEQDFHQMMKQVGRDFPEFNTSYYQNFTKFLFHPDEMKEQALHACLPTWMNFMPIDEEGTALSCTQPIGNLHESEVSEVWCGEKRMGFLRSISKFGKCNNPCWLNCTSVAPEWIGFGLKTMLKLGKVSAAAESDFKKMELYTGAGS